MIFLSLMEEIFPNYSFLSIYVWLFSRYLLNTSEIGKGSQGLYEINKYDSCLLPWSLQHNKVEILKNTICNRKIRATREVQ